MTRVKRGMVSRAKHKQVLKLAKGYRMTRHKLYKVASEAVLHAGQYAFAGRKHRKRQMRRLWIMRINAALKPHELKYSQFMHSLRQQKITLDRKILSLFAQDQPFFLRLLRKIKLA